MPSAIPPTTHGLTAASPEVSEAATTIAFKDMAESSPHEALRGPSGQRSGRLPTHVAVAGDDILGAGLPDPAHRTASAPLLGAYPELPTAAEPSPAPEVWRRVAHPPRPLHRPAQHPAAH